MFIKIINCITEKFAHEVLLPLILCSLNQTAMAVGAHITPSAGHTKRSNNFILFCQKVEGPTSLRFFLAYTATIFTGVPP